jgi:transposase
VTCIELHTSQKIRCGGQSVLDWNAQYKSKGEYAFREIHKNQTYFEELKQMVVEECLRGDMGLLPLAIKYKIRSKRQIQDWWRDKYD